MAATITNQINAIIASVLAPSSSKSLAPPSMRIPDTLKGIDDLIRAGFVAYRDSCFHWLLAATGLVVVGLVLEGPELWYEISSIVHHWRFARRWHFSLPEEHPPNWVKLFAFVGWLFIVVGVAGEYVADSFVSKADGYVQTFDEILLADAQRKSGLANERAAVAFERAAQTEKEAAEDLKTTNIARQKAEEARQKAEGVQLQVAELTASNLKLEEAIAPRHLTPKQVHELEALTQFSKDTVDLGSYLNDPEGLVLSSQILDALKKSGINIVDNRSTLAGSSDVFLGVFVQHGDQSLREKLEAILSENGLTKTAVISRTINGKPLGARMFELNFDAPPDSVRIMVGLKPIPKPSDAP